MGGQACVLYGGAKFSRATDIMVVADADNLTRLQAAVDELQAAVIAVPPFERAFLEAGHAVHFRCGVPEAAGIRLDVMAKLRGVADFETVWKRRTTLETPTDAIDVLSLADLVTAKKTQRDKDWPMITRLVEAHYARHADAPDDTIREFWLRELRTPAILIAVARSAPRVCTRLQPCDRCSNMLPPGLNRGSWRHCGSKKKPNARPTVAIGRRSSGSSSTSATPAEPGAGQATRAITYFRYSPSRQLADTGWSGPAPRQSRNCTPRPDWARRTILATGGDAQGALDLADIRNSLRALMWRQVGVERAEEPLAEALETVEGWCRYVLPRQFADPQGWQLQNMLEVARLMIRSGLVRRETRGVHFRSDHPRADDAWRSHIVWRRDVPDPFLEPIPPAPVAAAGELLGHHGPRPLR